MSRNGKKQWDPNDPANHRVRNGGPGASLASAVFPALEQEPSQEPETTPRPLQEDSGASACPQAMRLASALLSRPAMIDIGQLERQIAERESTRPALSIGTGVSDKPALTLADIAQLADEDARRALPPVVENFEGVPTVHDLTKHPNFKNLPEPVQAAVHHVIKHGKPSSSNPDTKHATKSPQHKAHKDLEAWVGQQTKGHKEKHEADWGKVTPGPVLHSIAMKGIGHLDVKPGHSLNVHYGSGSPHSDHIDPNKKLTPEQSTALAQLKEKGHLPEGWKMVFGVPRSMGHGPGHPIHNVDAKPEPQAGPAPKAAPASKAAASPETGSKSAVGHPGGKAPPGIDSGTYARFSKLDLDTPEEAAKQEAAKKAKADADAAEAAKMKAQLKPPASKPKSPMQGMLDKIMAKVQAAKTDPKSRTSTEHAQAGAQELAQHAHEDPHFAELFKHMAAGDWKAVMDHSEKTKGNAAFDAAMKHGRKLAGLPEQHDFTLDDLRSVFVEETIPKPKGDRIGRLLKGLGNKLRSPAEAEPGQFNNASHGTAPLPEFDITVKEQAEIDEIFQQLGLDEAQVRLLPSGEGKFRAVHKKTGHTVGSVTKGATGWKGVGTKPDPKGRSHVTGPFRHPKLATRAIAGGYDESTGAIGAGLLRESRTSAAILRGDRS